MEWGHFHASEQWVWVLLVLSFFALFGEHGQGRQRQCHGGQKGKTERDSGGWVETVCLHNTDCGGATARRDKLKWGGQEFSLTPNVNTSFLTPVPPAACAGAVTAMERLH